MGPIDRRFAHFGRLTLLLLFALAAIGLATVIGGRPGTTANVAGQGASGDGYLLAADTGAEKVYVYQLPGLEQTAQLDDVKLGAHAGVVALPDGRVLFVDDKNVEFVVLKLEVNGQPTVIGRAKIPTPTPLGRVAWGMVDPAYQYFAVSSDNADAPSQTVTLLNLTTYQVDQLQLELKTNLNGAYEEVHPYLAGTPLSLFVTTGQEISIYAVADVLAGTARPTASVRINSNPHGPVIAPELGRLYVTTADGLNMFNLVDGGLGQHRNLGWETAGIKVGQNSRPRLSYDGGHIYGAVVAREPTLAPEEWAQSQVYVHATDLRSETASLIPLASGIVGRFQISEPFGLFVNLHPDGDVALFLDVAPGSPAFHQVVARVPLERLANGPVAGQPIPGREARSAAITPDGRWAFVSHGGDGRISVVDTTTRSVTQSITVPTSMKGGGYLAAVQPGARLVDIAAR